MNKLLKCGHNQWAYINCDIAVAVSVLRFTGCGLFFMAL
jgi:hypothetical protein